MYIGPIRWLSRQLDKAGTPFVQRTGFVPLDEGKYYNQLPESAKKKVRERRRLRNSYEYGGEVNEFQRKTRRDIMQESLVDGRPDYNKMFQNQNEYQKDFANYWYTERAKNPKYSDQIGGDKLGSVLSNIDKATWKTPTEAMRDNMVGQGYNPTDAQINQQLNILKEKGTKGFANPKAHSYTSLRPANTWHEGVGHMVGDNTPAILNASPNVRISNPDSSYEDYVNGVPNNAYLRQLGKPSKYRPFEEVKDIFRSPDKALQDYRYLRNPTEKKSIMNQFDEYLMNNYTPSTYPQTTKEFKEAIEKAPDIHRNMKLLLKIHNKPSILFKDFKNRPLVNNTTKDKNKELV